MHPPAHTLTWPQMLLWLSWLSLFLIIAVGRQVYISAQRRAKWSEVVKGAHQWVESVGGTLKRVSEQPAVLDGRANITACRYRVTFLDRQNAKCVVTLRCTTADGVWSMENLTRETQQDFPEVGAQPNEAELSAEGYARRHRGKIANVPVMFAPPRRRKHPRRSS